MFTNDQLDTVKRLFAHLSKPPNINLDGEDGEQTCINIGGFLCIGQVKVKVPTLGKQAWVPGYDLTVASTINNYPHAPDDVDVSEVAKDRYFGAIAAKAFTTYCDHLAKSTLDDLSTEALAQEYQKENL
jgi:hypothetical protein